MNHKPLRSLLCAGAPIWASGTIESGSPPPNSSAGRLAGRENVRFVKRHACRWAAWGIVAATLTLIDTLLELQVDFDYASLISGTDYPIKSNREISVFLGAHPGTEFLETFLLTAPNKWSPHGGMYKAPHKLLCRHVRFRSRIVRLPGMRTLPAGLEPYGGSQWWTLTKNALEYIRHFVQTTPQFVSFSKLSFIPDESFIQCILSNSPLQDRICNDDLRVIIWDRPTPPYPATLMLEDLDLLLASNKLFARKFDWQLSGPVLDALDARHRAFERADQDAMNC
jgi:hypothetical protein